MTFLKTLIILVTAFTVTLHVLNIHVLRHLIFTAIPWNSYYYPHFTDEDIVLSRLHNLAKGHATSEWVAEPIFKPIFAWLQSEFQTSLLHRLDASTFPSAFSKANKLNPVGQTWPFPCICTVHRLNKLLIPYDSCIFLGNLNFNVHNQVVLEQSHAHSLT